MIIFRKCFQNNVLQSFGRNLHNVSIIFAQKEKNLLYGENFRYKNIKDVDKF